MTALMIAAHYGFTDIVKSLVRHGAKINLQNKVSAIRNFFPVLRAFH
jgi:ankyrin repeat protein